MRKKKTVIIGIAIVFLISLFLLADIPKIILQQLGGMFSIVEGCYSSDGIHFEKREKVASFFGMTDGIILKDGTILITGIDFSDRGGIRDEETGYRLRDVGFLASKDGWNFSKFKPKIINLAQDITAFGDPVIVELPDNHYRMYFTERPSCFLMSAYSEDGYSYRFEGKVTGERAIDLTAVDFTVLYEKNTKKYYIYTRVEAIDEMWVLESNDGRYFTRRFKIQAPFSFQFSIIDEGDYYIAYGGHLPSDNKPGSNLRYPVKAMSKDGLNWQRTKEQPNGFWLENRIYCHAYAVFKLPDGYYFY